MASKSNTVPKPRKRVLQAQKPKRRHTPSLASHAPPKHAEGVDMELEISDHVEMIKESQAEEKRIGQGKHRADLQSEDEVDYDDETLTKKQLAFVIGYLQHGNATRAYEEAYDCANMKRETIWAQASVVLKNHKVAARIRAQRRSMMRAAEATKAWALEQMMQTAARARAGKHYDAAIRAIEMVGKTDEAGRVFDFSGRGGGVTINGPASGGAAGGLPSLDVWYREVVLVGRAAPSAETVVSEGPVRALEVRPEKG